MPERDLDRLRQSRLDLDGARPTLGRGKSVSQANRGREPRALRAY